MLLLLLSDILKKNLQVDEINIEIRNQIKLNLEQRGMNQKCIESANLGIGEVLVINGSCTILCFIFLGIKLKELKHDMLPDYYEDISVRGDELAVAGWADSKLLLFKLQHL